MAAVEQIDDPDPVRGKGKKSIDQVPVVGRREPDSLFEGCGYLFFCDHEAWAALFLQS